MAYPKTRHPVTGIRVYLPPFPRWRPLVEGVDVVTDGDVYCYPWGVSPFYGSSYIVPKPSNGAIGSYGKLFNANVVSPGFWIYRPLPPGQTWDGSGVSRLAGNVHFATPLPLP